tara:strand:- start:351 stop:1628 length:1278 start_codon:yes stop_codon:yes gene_type:complete
MADEVKTEEEDNNTFGFFDNKYVRGGVAAVVAAYAAKNDPYLLEGFAEKIDELEVADRARREKFIESATESATKEIARNKLRRLERRETIAPKIKQAVANGINAVVAGRAYKAGHLPTLMKLKMANSDLDINGLYQISEENMQKISGFSDIDVIEALAGPTLKLQKTFDSLKAPRTINPLRNFLGGGDDGSAQKEIQERVDAETTSDVDIKDINYDLVEGLSEKGRRAFASTQKVRNITTEQIKSSFTANLSNALGVKSNITSGGLYVFDSDDDINEAYAMKIADQMTLEAEDLITKDFLSPANARSQVYNKYFKNVKDKGVQINMDVVGPKGLKILPAGWTPAKSLGGNTGSSTGGGTGGSKTGKVTLQSLKAQWLKKKDDLLKQYGNNKFNLKYKAQIASQGAAVQKQYQVLGGNPSDIDLTP